MEMVLVNEISCAMCEMLGWRNICGGWHKGVHSFGVCSSWGEREEAMGWLDTLFPSPRSRPIFNVSILSMLSYYFCVEENVHEKKTQQDERWNKQREESEMCSDEAKLK
jgi:hypothetical protein